MEPCFQVLDQNRRGESADGGQSVAGYRFEVFKSDRDYFRAKLLEPELDPAIDNASFCVRINLSEGRHLVRWKNHLAQASLPSVCYVFEIDKKAVLAKGLFSKDS